MRHRHRLNATHMVYWPLSPVGDDRRGGAGGSGPAMAMDRFEAQIADSFERHGRPPAPPLLRLCEQVFVPSWARSRLDWDVRQGRGSPRGTGMIIEFHLTGV